jgi:hypothetical protein
LRKSTKPFDLSEISEAKTISNFAALPLKVTLVAPVESVPRIVTAAPT